MLSKDTELLLPGTNLRIYLQLAYTSFLLTIRICIPAKNTFSKLATKALVKDVNLVQS